MPRTQVKGAHFTQQQRLARLESLCRMLAPHQKPADTLASLGVFDFYPYLAALMCGHQWGPGVQQAGAAYLTYISLLNQVRRLASSATAQRMQLALVRHAAGVDTRGDFGQPATLWLAKIHEPVIKEAKPQTCKHKHTLHANITGGDDGHTAVQRRRRAAAPQVRRPPDRTALREKRADCAAGEISMPCVGQRMRIINLGPCLHCNG